MYLAIEPNSAECRPRPSQIALFGRFLCTMGGQEFCIDGTRTYPTSYSIFQLMSSHAKNIYIEIAAVCVGLVSNFAARFLTANIILQLHFKVYHIEWTYYITKKT